tara:strand:- start:264 stop:593 length:330 start_codon:yes stop_codon:yes gene_type:complete
MKITRSQLRNLIKESIREHKSILLEMPPYPAIGHEQANSSETESDEHRGELSKRTLFHMSQQSQQLHDMLNGGENLDQWVEDEIAKAAACLEKVFKAITYEKGPGQARL